MSNPSRSFIDSLLLKYAVLSFVIFFECVLKKHLCIPLSRHATAIRTILLFPAASVMLGHEYDENCLSLGNVTYLFSELR